MAGLIPALVKEIDPNQPVAEVRAMQDFVDDDLAQSRLTMLLLAGFAAAALLPASMGLYGVIAFNATQRTQEIGVRVALGASRGNVLRRLVMQCGLPLTGTGLAIGVAAALLAAVALVATYLPARGATRIEPMRALRAE